VRVATEDVLAPGFSTEPYWTDGLPPFVAPQREVGHRVDAAVVGAGYAGLSAALTLARAGRNVAVFEAARVGTGASSRSAGSLGHVPKAGLADLKTRYGESVAHRVYAEAREAREYVETLVREHQIECGLRTSGRFIAAHSPRAYATLKRSLPELQDTWGAVELVPREKQRALVGSDAYFGGLSLATAATLQPALLHYGLARAAVSAGALLLQETRVTDIKSAATGFTVATAVGTVTARAVVIATNAETGRETATLSRLRRRMAVIPAYVAVTEPIAPERMMRILPNQGPISDTCKILHYMAPNENRQRLVMSARAGRSDGGLEEKARRIFGYFAARFPDLQGVRVSHCWTGRFAVSSDLIPHIGVEDGLYYVLGCCGTGVPMSTYLGHKLALKILRHDASSTVFDRRLPPMSAWKRAPGLLPLAVRAYDLRDRLFR
jgi:glycine/D-amino acid oxidase-like deaminating enzyme